MAEFDWANTLYAAMVAVTNTPAGKSEPVCVCEGMYVTDSSSWGYHGHYPVEGNYATVFDANSAYEQSIPQEDGTDKNEVIDELKNLQEVVLKGSRRPNNQGLFISGMKYTMTRKAMAGAADDDETLRKVTCKLNEDDDEHTVTFNKIFFVSAGVHQLVIAEDNQTYVYLAYGNKENNGLEQSHGRLAEAIGIAAYYAGSGDPDED